MRIRERTSAERDTLARHIVAQGRPTALVAVVWLTVALGLMAGNLPVSSTAQAQSLQVELPLDGRQGRELLLRNFRPNSNLKVASHPKTHAKFPVVDVHTHFRYKLRSSDQALDDFVA